MAGETGLSLARRAAGTVVNAAFMTTSSMTWPTVRRWLTVLLSRPDDDSDQDLQRRLDRTRQRMNEPSHRAESNWGVSAGVWDEQVQQWTDLFRGALDDRPELAGDLAGLVEELTTRFGLPLSPVRSARVPVSVRPVALAVRFSAARRRFCATRGPGCRTALSAGGHRLIWAPGIPARREFRRR